MFSRLLTVSALVLALALPLVGPTGSAYALEQNAPVLRDTQPATTAVTTPSTTPVTTVTPVTPPVTDPATPSLWTQAVLWVLSAVGTAGTALIAWIFAWLIGKVTLSDAQKAAMDALHAGVDTTYLTLYQQFKTASADGVITPQEAALLRQNAIDQALLFAKGPALAFLKAMAAPLLQALVQRIVAQKKAAAARPTIVVNPFHKSDGVSGNDGPVGVTGVEVKLAH